MKPYLIRTLSLLSFSLLPLTVLAQAQSEAPTWYQDQYIITISTIPALTQKAIDQVQDVADQDLGVLDQSGKTILMAPQDQIENGDTENIAYLKNSDEVCQKLREARRETLRAERAGEAAKIVRLVKCSPNIVMKAQVTPNDSGFSQLWGLDNSSNTDIDAPEAWNMSKGSSNTIIAIIDTGVDYNHPDLKNNLWVNPGEIPGNGIDDDGDGYIDDVYGINTITGSGDPMDDAGHGTHVAGTIGALGNNSQGVVGVNWNVKMMACKFLDSGGSGSLWGAINCIDWVTNMHKRGVNVIASSNSWGYQGPVYQEIYDAIERARQEGILFVAAAGNDGGNCDQNTNLGRPGTYPNTNIISVAATDITGNLASFSNRGASCTDIAAPGSGIYSTYPLAKQGYGGYAFLSGTSMATPHVSGAIALLYSYAPWLSMTQLKDTLLNSAKQLPSLSGQVGTGGLLNLYKLLNQAPAPSGPTPTPYPTSTPTRVATATPIPTSTPTPTRTPTPAPGYYNISVSVWANGVKVKGAHLKLETDKNTTQYAATKADGYFTFYHLLGAGHLSASGTYPGYSCSPFESDFSSDFTLNIYCSANNYGVSVEVVDQEKKPLPGVTVGYLGTYYNTDASGRVNLNIAYGSSYDLSLSKTGYKMGAENLQGTVLGAVTRRVLAKAAN